MTNPGSVEASSRKKFRARADVLALLALIVAAAYCVGALLHFPGWRWQLLLVVAIFVSLAFGVFFMRVSHSRGADERLMKILAWSGWNTFLTTLALLAGLAILHDAGQLPWETVGIGEALTGGMIIMMAIFALWYAYYFVRGDVA